MDNLFSYIPDDKRHILEEASQWDKVFMNGKANFEYFNGKEYSAGFCAETAKYIRDEWNGIRENDVFVASYPKSGTYWTVDIVKHILSAGNPKLLMAMKSMPGSLTFLSMGKIPFVELLDSMNLPRRVFSTHMDGEDFPLERVTRKGAKVIHVLRNPKDQTVSWFHFINMLATYREHNRNIPEWKEYLESYRLGLTASFSRPGEWYPEHIQSWHKHHHQNNIKVIYFEDLKKDLPFEVRQIAEYLDVNLNENEINEIAKSCTFEAMKKNISSSNESTATKREDRLLRKGGVGGWKNYFTVAQSEAIDAEFNEKLSDTDIQFTYQL